MSTTCKLCQAFAASQLPTAAERELAGSDSFSRATDICDACLSQDYAQRSHVGLIEMFCLWLGMLAALPVGMVVIVKDCRPVASSWLLSLITLPAGTAIVVAGVAWMSLYALVRGGREP